MQEAQIDRAGCFKYEPVAGAAANNLPNPVPEELKTERFERLMQLQQQISTQRLQSKVGSVQQVLIDDVGEGGATGRSKADAPEIDGLVFVDTDRELQIGEWVQVKITEADEYDLTGTAL